MEEGNFQAETEKVSLQEALEKIREQEQEITKAIDRERQLRADLERTLANAETDALQAEVDKMRAVEKARNKEREHSRQLVDELRERLVTETRTLMEKIAALEERAATAASPLIRANLRFCSRVYCSHHSVCR